MLTQQTDFKKTAPCVRRGCISAHSNGAKIKKIKKRVFLSHPEAGGSCVKSQQLQ